MSIFLPQPRHLRFNAGSEPPVFPSLAEGTLVFGPGDAFGVQDGTQRTTIRAGTSPSALFAANEGTFRFQGSYIDPVSFSFALGEHIALKGDGNRIAFQFMASSAGQLEANLQSVNLFIPPVLTFRLGIFVWIREYLVRVGDSQGRFELARGRLTYRGATAKTREEQIVSCFEDWLRSDAAYARWLSAAYYYRHALHLWDFEPDPQSAFAEVILNLTKAIEILCSADRDRLRKTAQSWGFESSFIERRLIPLLLVRNELDVAHPCISGISWEDHNLLQSFVIAAEGAVGEVISRVFILLRSGSTALPPFSGEPDRGTVKLLRMLAAYLESTDGQADTDTTV